MTGTPDTWPLTVQVGAVAALVAVAAVLIVTAAIADRCRDARIRRRRNATSLPIDLTTQPIEPPDGRLSMPRGQPDWQLATSEGQQADDDQDRSAPRFDVIETQYIPTSGNSATTLPLLLLPS